MANILRQPTGYIFFDVLIHVLKITTLMGFLMRRKENLFEVPVYSYWYLLL